MGSSVGDPLPGSAVEAEKRHSGAGSCAFEDLLDRLGKSGEVVLPGVLDELLVGVVARILRDVDDDDVPGEGMGHLQVVRGLGGTHAGREQAFADDELVGSDARIAGVEQTGAQGLNLRGGADIAGEVVEGLCLSVGDGELVCSGRLAELVEHGANIVLGKLLGEKAMREQQAQEEEQSENDLPAH